MERSSMSEDGVARSELSTAPRVEKREGSEAWLLGAVMFGLYGRCGLLARKFIIKVLWKAEGTGLYSITLRRIALKYHRVEVGMYTRGPLLKPWNCPPGARIGRYCSIHPSARLFGANHPMNTRSTHGLFYNPHLHLSEKDLLTRTQIQVGHDVFIGYNAIVTSSVTTIGNGAVIGAGAVVHQDVPAYSVVVGNPARVIRFRFSKEIIQELQDSRWWERTIDDLRTELPSFQIPLDGSKQLR